MFDLCDLYEQTPVSSRRADGTERDRLLVRFYGLLMMGGFDVSQLPEAHLKQFREIQEILNISLA